jgi:zinc transporter
MKQKHIIFSYAFDSTGKAVKLNNDQIAIELKNENLAWVHLDGNHHSTKSWLKKEVNYLDHIIIDALIAEETRPRMMEFDGGLLIILRSVNLDKNSEPEDMVSIRMWIDHERIITIQRRDMKAIFNIQANIEAGKDIKGPAEFLYNLLYEILTQTSPFLFALTEKIDHLDEKIMGTRDVQLREEILQIRTQSAVFRRYLVPQREVISKLRYSDRAWIDDWAKRHFQENFDQATHMVEEIEEATSRSQILNDELMNASAEKLNRNMYKLSLITVIFMPLTFITGLFGMNVGGVPLSSDSLGFYICTGAMIVIAMLQILFFKKKDWF